MLVSFYLACSTANIYLSPALLLYSLHPASIISFISPALQPTFTSHQLYCSTAYIQHLSSALSRLLYSQHLLLYSLHPAPTSHQLYCSTAYIQHLSIISFIQPASTSLTSFHFFTAYSQSK
jgi:hypothetical protein